MLLPPEREYVKVKKQCIIARKRPKIQRGKSPNRFAAEVKNEKSDEFKRTRIVHICPSGAGSGAHQL
jgi:hypothetical protein